MPVLFVWCCGGYSTPLYRLSAPAWIRSAQIRFHEHHPEYCEYWSPDTVDANNAGSAELVDEPNSEQLPDQDVSDVPRTLQVPINVMRGLDPASIESR